MILIYVFNIVQIESVSAVRVNEFLVLDEIDGMIEQHLLSLTLRKDGSCGLSGLATAKRAKRVVCMSVTHDQYHKLALHNLFSISSIYCCQSLLSGGELILIRLDTAGGFHF